ncbi:MAG: sporulation protein [Lachnospiraceae bacterium]|nr:sporulation protein [Lachnospiraceae bacterium]
MLNLLKQTRGYLRIHVSGFSPERFMNLCSNRDILLWDIEQDADGYRMCVSLQSFYRLKAIVRKTRTKVVIIEKCGLPFLVPVMQKRRVFVGGLLLAIAFWYCSTWFVWDIEVDGNYRITTDQLERFLKSRSVRTGMRKDELDIGSLEKEIRKNFTLVTWTSAKLDGTKLLISIKENDAPILSEEDLQKTVTGTDLVTEYGGKIVSMVVRSGVPKAAVGDEIEAGTMLVDGKVPVYNEDGTVREYILTDADADIMLEHIKEFKSTLPYEYVAKEYTGREKKQPYIRIGDNFEGKIPVEDPYLIYDRVMRQSQPLIFEKLDIPIFSGSYTYREYRNVEYEYSLEEAEKLLNEKLMVFLSTLEEKGVQIIEKNVKIDTSDNGWIVHGEFLVHEPVGKRVVTDRGVETSDE